MTARPHIILVDDDYQLRALFAQLFASQFPDAHVSIASHGVDALALYEEQGADLILSDCEMPQMDGPTLAATLRATGVSVPIVLMSASVRYAETSIAAGATAFFQKYGMLSQIIAVARSLLGA